MTAATPSPLTGRTLLVTRAAHQAESTADAIARRGGQALLLPCLEMIYREDAIDGALGALRRHPQAELLVTSRNGVDSLLARTTPADLRSLIGGRRVVAVGGRTAAALHAIGVREVATPSEQSQLGVAAWWDRHGWPKRLIFVRAEQGRDDLLPLLRLRGCDTQFFACYGSRVPATPVPDAILRQLRAGTVDAVLLGSAATARGLIDRVGITLARKPIAAAISERVAKASEQLGLRVQVVAPEASFDAMLDCLGDYFGGSV